ncbi:MAG: hypothetical protein WC756_18000 [Taibaiella sp.]|jgi:hypothetical protein
MNLSNENIEEYLLLLADKELDEAEENEVMAFVEKHVAYKPMLEAYLATRLDSTESFIFPDKESLLKPEPMVLPLRKTNVKPLKLVAAVAVLLGMGVAITLMFTTDPPANHNKGVVAKNSVIKNTVVPPIKTTKDTTAVFAQVSKQSNVIGINNKQPKAVNSNVHNTVAYTAPVKQKEKVPVQLASASVNEIAVDAAIQPQAIAMINETASPEREDSVLPEWLPVSNENLQGVNDLVAHIQTLKERIQEKAQTLKNTAFVIRLGDKQISIGK